MPHLINVDDLSTGTLDSIFTKAEHYQASAVAKESHIDTYSGIAASNLFFEDSTRTCNSFQLAQLRHSMLVLTPQISQSALNKGETIEDTLLNLQAMGSRLFVVRHENHEVFDTLIPCLADDSYLINAGSGMSHHPTQAILDLYTIRQYKNAFNGLSIAIIGDSKHSRVARSLIPLLKQMGVDDIRLIAPPELLAADLVGDQVRHYASIREGLKQVDVAYCLRIQKERIDKRKHPSNETFHGQFGLTEELLTFAKSDAIVMHPGPINRGIEIASSVADGPQSVILQQVTNSLPVRMAIIDYVFGGSR